MRLAGKPTYQELEQKVKQLEKSALVQKRSEKELRKSLNLYRLISEGTSDLIAITTFSLKPVYTYVSPSHKAIMGFETGELIGQPCLQFIHPDDKSKLLPLLRKYLSAKVNEFFNRRDWVSSTETIEYRAKDKSGEWHHLQSTANFIGNKLLFISKDISERKRQEKLKADKDAAEAANKAKSEFLANMSHELRTPLNHIIGFTELIADKHCGDLNATQEEYLNDVLQSGNHLLALINDVLEISKIEAGKLTLELSEVNIRTLLANSPTMIKTKALQRGIKLSTDFDKVPAMIKTDGHRLKQILYNLLSNAVRFTPAGGEISLNACRLKNSELSVRDPGRSGGKFIKISVKDTGTGLRSDDLERVFYPFEQAENSANCDCQGTGLGLSLSKSLVEQLGGRIWAESEGEGKGITFSFIVPC
jgi:PAS domain S-box-containing protein